MDAVVEPACSELGGCREKCAKDNSPVQYEKERECCSHRELRFKDETSEGKTCKKFETRTQGKESKCENRKSQSGSLSPGDKVPKRGECQRQNQQRAPVTAQV